MLQVDKPGVLILSPFAGAGETMHEALVVNPYEMNDTADIIHRAITMPEDERELRMYHLRMREKQMDITHWLNLFLSDMGALMAEDGESVVPAPASGSKIEPMTLEDFDEFLSAYIDETSKLALLLDYDGTLAPIAPKPHLAFLPKETKKVCNLTKESKNEEEINDFNLCVTRNEELENQ
jgi:trehalose 6-phosphate synthase/phosphatase